MPLAAGTAAKVGHVILGYYKWICEGSLKLPGAVRIMGRPSGTDPGVYCVVGDSGGFIEMPEVGADQKDPEKIYKFDICSCNSAHSSIV